MPYRIARQPSTFALLVYWATAVILVVAALTVLPRDLAMLSVAVSVAIAVGQTVRWLGQRRDPTGRASQRRRA